MYHLRVPQTAEELDIYYQFRWEMLRKPLRQPQGSERDAWDALAHHQMVVDEQGNPVAIGRMPWHIIRWWLMNREIRSLSAVSTLMPTMRPLSASWPFILRCRVKGWER